MANVRICHRNYLNADLVNDISVSSQATANPATNLYLSNRRSQTWRSAGCFEITSANKAIVFKESNSGSLTAEIAEATYSSDSSFLSAVKSAFEAVGDSTYTVERLATTKKIKITSDGNGGDGIFSILWTDADTTAGDVLGFLDSADDTGALNYTADNIRIHTSEWIVWDLGTVSNPKAFIICPILNRAMGISNTAMIKIQANASDDWDSPAVDLSLSHSDTAISSFSSSGIGGYRYWRLYVEDKDNANGYVEISKAYLGGVIEPERGALRFPLQQRFVDLAHVTKTEMGSRFTSLRQQTEEFDLDWFGLNVADYNNIREFIKETGIGTPFFMSLDPNQVYSEDLSVYVKLFHFAEDLPTHTLVSPKLWNGSWRVEEVV